MFRSLVCWLALGRARGTPEREGIWERVERAHPAKTLLTTVRCSLQNTDLGSRSKVCWRWWKQIQNSQTLRTKVSWWSIATFNRAFLFVLFGSVSTVAPIGDNPPPVADVLSFFCCSSGDVAKWIFPYFHPTQMLPPPFAIHSTLGMLGTKWFAVCSNLQETGCLLTSNFISYFDRYKFQLNKPAKNMAHWLQIVLSSYLLQLRVTWGGLVCNKWSAAHWM